jgi:phosphopantothenoylcysteine decarboxylase/phosphopantothenate--cysteine ligase
MATQDTRMEFADTSVIVGVTGSIAAYKAAELVSRLKQSGADVNVVMTRWAQELVGPMTFHTLSMNPVCTDMFPEGRAARPYHIELVDRSDLMVIAPATANIIGKIAAGIGDDVLSTTVLAAYDMPVVIAPAMNVRMYENPIVQKNIKTLQELGYVFVEPEEGYLACGYRGKGRMASLDRVLDAIRKELPRARDRNRRFPKRPDGS